MKPPVDFPLIRSREKLLYLLSCYFYWENRNHSQGGWRHSVPSHECFYILAFCEIHFEWGLSLGPLINPSAAFSPCSFLELRGTDESRRHWASFSLKKLHWCHCSSGHRGLVSRFIVSVSLSPWPPSDPTHPHLHLHFLFLEEHFIFIYFFDDLYFFSVWMQHIQARPIVSLNRNHSNLGCVDGCGIWLKMWMLILLS